VQSCASGGCEHLQALRHFSTSAGLCEGEVAECVLANARRNLTADEYRYYIGKLYEGRKHQGTRTDLTSGHFDQKLIAEDIADEHGMSEKTVRRAATFARDVDTVAELR
jgi:hypothetical protein